MTNREALALDFFQPQTSARVLASNPLLTNQDAGWDNIALQVYEPVPACEVPVHTHVNHCIAVCRGHGPTVERYLASEYKTEQERAGDFILVPKDVEHQLVIPQESPGCLMILLKPNFVSGIAQESVDPDRVELLPTFLQPDPFIHGTALALREALETYGSGSQLYAEALSQALAVHLLTKYTTRSAKLHSYEDGLSRYQLRQALDYIQANLGQNIKLEDVATFLGMSQYYFCHLFRKSMGITPHKYIIQQRVERAKTLLLQFNQQTIADIALKCGFANHSHLCLHFRQLTGTTPRAYQRQSSK
ncbi:MAG: helix-turn-helix domain-containing protein [Elainellaceae cyanobacterium]